MIYSYDISTPANTSKSDPLKTIIPVTVGLVYRLDIRIPPGHVGLTGLWINRAGFRVWPSNLDQVFTGDDMHINFEDVYLIENAPTQFLAYSYNLDDTYDHSFLVSLGVVSKEIFMARYLPTMGYDYFRDLLDQISTQQRADQDAQDQAIIADPFPGLVVTEDK